MSVREMSAIVFAWQSAVLGPDEDSDSQDIFALIDWGLARRSYQLPPRPSEGDRDERRGVVGKY